MPPFSIIWTDVSGNVLPSASFPIAFPGTHSPPQQLQVSSNATALQTFETLIGVRFFLTGDANDVNIVQNLWPSMGGPSQPHLNGGYDVSFDFGSSYVRFDSTNGVEANPTSWIPLPVEAVGAQGIAQTLGAFDVAHLIIRVIIPPGAIQYKKLDIRLGIDFDII